MRVLGAAGQLRDLWRASGRADAAYGGGRLAAARRARRVRTEGAWLYDEALNEGLLDPAMDVAVRRRHISKHAREEVQRRLNPDSLDAFTEDKLAFHRYCDALGVPSPALHGTVGRAGGWSAATGRAIAGADGLGRMIREELPREFVVKPANGYLGRSVHAVATEGEDLLRIAGGRLVEVGAFHREILDDPDFPLFIVEERLRDHPELERLHRSETLQTTRLISVIEADGSVRLLTGWTKLVLKPGSSDNYDSGSGNAKVELDVGTGEYLRTWMPRPDGLGSHAVPAIPGLGLDLRGQTMPMFAEARDLVRAAAPHFLPMRTIGWDIGITTRGPVVVEANNYWGHTGVPLNAATSRLLQAG